MHRNRILSMLFIAQSVSLLCGGIVSAEEHDHRQHGAHEHGVAQLNIAIEGKLLQIEFSSPAMNIVGFEHAPRNEKEQQVITQAVAILKNVTQIFTLTPAAKCKPVSIDVESPMMRKAQEQHETLDKDEHEDGHADFYAEYSFECQQMSVLTTMDVGLFKKFPATEDIDVRLLTEKGQTVVELNAKMTRIKF